MHALTLNFCYNFCNLYLQIVNISAMLTKSMSEKKQQGWMEHKFDLKSGKIFHRL